MTTHRLANDTEQAYVTGFGTDEFVQGDDP